MSQEYCDGYEGDSQEWQLPDHIASTYEHHAGDYIVFDKKTGEQLTRKYTIVWVDSREGYFVEKRKTANGYLFIAHQNTNLEIVKDNDFYQYEEVD